MGRTLSTIELNYTTEVIGFDSDISDDASSYYQQPLQDYDKTYKVEPGEILVGVVGHFMPNHGVLYFGFILKKLI